MVEISNNKHNSFVKNKYIVQIIKYGFVVDVKIKAPIGCLSRHVMC